MPWIWKNMAKPIFQYFFVTTVQKITIRYFSLLAGLALTNPMLKLWVKVNWNADNRSILVCLDWNQDWIDYMSLGIAILATIVYFVFIRYEFKKLREPSCEILDAVKDSDEKINEKLSFVLKRLCSQGLVCGLGGSIQ